MWLNGIFCLLNSLTFANELQVRTEFVEYKSQISASYESSELATPDGTINGSGVRATYNHWLSQNFMVEFGSSIALNNQNSAQSNSFTHFNLYSYYNLWGTPYKLVKKSYLSDALVSSETIATRHALFIGGGISQYFLNGNRGVYSASGLGLGLIYQFQVWNTLLRVSSRWNQLQSSQISIDGLSFDFGIVFSL